MQPTTYLFGGCISDCKNCKQDYTGPVFRAGFLCRFLSLFIPGSRIFSASNAISGLILRRIFSASNAFLGLVLRGICLTSNEISCLILRRNFSASNAISGYILRSIFSASNAVLPLSFAVIFQHRMQFPAIFSAVSV